MADKRSILKTLHARVRSWIADWLPPYEQSFGRFFGTVERPTKPFRQVSAVRAVVAKKASLHGSVPALIATADDKLIESGPLFDLLDKPNPMMSGAEFWRATSALLDLTGECHWIFTRMMGNRPTEIMPIGATQMDQRVNEEGQLVGWKFYPAGQRNQWEPIGLDELWTLKLDAYDASRPFRGSSPLEACGLAISQFYQADLANEASLANGVEPGGVFTMEGTPSQPQVDHVREELKDRHGGPRNRRRPMILYGGLKWERIAAAFNEMEFAELKRMSRADIAITLDVDPAAMGWFDGASDARSQSQSARDSLWVETVYPRAQWIAAEFDRGVVSRFEGDVSLKAQNAMRRDAPQWMKHRHGLSRRAMRQAQQNKRSMFLFFDFSGIPAFQRARLELMKQLDIAVKAFKSRPSDVNDQYDLGLVETDAMKLVWQTSTEFPFDAQTPTPDAADPNGAPPPREGDNGEETEVAPSPVDDTQNNGVPQGVYKYLTERQKLQMWQNWRSSWSGLERATRSKVSRYFHDLRAATLAALAKANIATDASRSETSDVTRDAIGALLLSVFEGANNKLIAQVGPLIREGVRLGGQQIMDEAAAAAGKQADDSDLFNIADPQAVSALRRRNINISGINRTLQRQLRKQLADGVANGESMSQLTERVRKEYNLAGSRASTIARTEIGAAVEEGRAVGRVQARVPMKSWLWSRKETGRPWHMQTEDNTIDSPIPNDSMFTIAQTGNRAPHPRASGTAKDDINCGCTTISRFPGDKVRDARLLRHLIMHGFTTFEAMTTRGNAA